MKSTLVTALVLNLIHAYIPSEKFQSICQSKGGDLHAHFKVDGIHFAQLNGKTAPYTKDLYICLKKGSSPANLSSIVIPIGGAPAVWLEPSNDEERFKSSCRGACGGDFQTATVTFKGETLGACQCYDKYPYSPMFTDKKSVHETTDDGVAPGGLVPKDPHTFQTCSEFSAKSPVQGLLNMACLCVKNPWPFPDFSVCKWAGGDPKALDVPGSPAVWIQKDADANGCAIAKKACDSACGEVSSANSTSTVSGCFQFMGLGQRASTMCMCKDGRYPTNLAGFEPMTSMDSDGKIPGSVSAAQSVASSLVWLVFAILIF